jgi:hypothetical protein
LSQVWLGELGLYRIAYGLGGIGLALVSLLADLVLDMAASVGDAVGWLAFLVIGAGQLAVAGIIVVGTFRAAKQRRPDGRVYGPIAVGLAVGFVCIQFVLTAVWIGWLGVADANL